MGLNLIFAFWLVIGGCGLSGTCTTLRYLISFSLIFMICIFPIIIITLQEKYNKKIGYAIIFSIIINLIGGIYLSYLAISEIKYCLYYNSPSVSFISCITDFGFETMGIILLFIILFYIHVNIKILINAFKENSSLI